MVINMKKNIIILSIGALFIALGVFFCILSNNKSEEYSNISMITIDELRQKVDNKETFVLVITQDGCSHCKIYKPILNKVGQKYNFTFYDITQTNMSLDDLSYLHAIANISGTPTTVFIQDGEEKSTLNRLVGNVEEYKLVDKLKALGYINE